MLKLWSSLFLQAFVRLKHGGRVLGVLAISAALTVPTVQAEKAWYPVEVDV